MRLAALFSGGKDSTYAMLLMEQMGHEVTHLVTIVPSDPYAMLFHTLNLDLIPLHAESMGKELVQVRSSGDEVEDLAALKGALTGLPIEGVITGAIASDYQWDRINGVCEVLGIKCFSPMWRKDQETLLRDMVDAGVNAIIVGTFAEGLDEKWLGRRLDHGTIDALKAIRGRYGINIAGEGGEYESLTVDSPMHTTPLKLVNTEVDKDRSSSRLRVINAVLDRS